MKKSIVRIFIAFLAAASGTSAFGGDLTADSVLSFGQLKADLAIFRRAYEELHPGLYRYNTKSQMDANFTALESEFGRDRTLRDAYLAFSVFLAKLKCGHSYANFYNQPKPIANALFKQRDKVPFYFKWIDGKMFVVRNFSGEARLKAGTEILSINGTPVATILAKLMTVARADGSNDAKRVAYLEVLGTDRFEAFDVFFPLFFPLRSEKLNLTIRPFGSKNAVPATVDALTYERRLAAMPAAAGAEPDAPAFELTFPKANTAVLRMPGWALYNSKWNWKKFIDDSMDDLVSRKTENLILDIRGNEGGLDIGDAIISRIASADVLLTKTKRYVRYQKIPSDLKPYLDTWDRSFDDWGKAASDPKDGLYTLTRFDDMVTGNVIRPSGKRYAGRVFVLIGATNSSATFQFARTINANRLGTLIGQPTGGNQRGITGGAFYFLRLPNTGIEIDLPLIGQYAIGDAPDAGIEPDVFVKPKADDIASGTDAELAAAFAIIEKGR